MNTLAKSTIAAVLAVTLTAGSFAKPAEAGKPRSRHRPRHRL